MSPKQRQVRSALADAARCHGPRRQAPALESRGIRGGVRVIAIVDEVQRQMGVHKYPVGQLRARRGLYGVHVPATRQQGQISPHRLRGAKAPPRFIAKCRPGVPILNKQWCAVPRSAAHQVYRLQLHIQQFVWIAMFAEFASRRRRSHGPWAIRIAANVRISAFESRQRHPAAARQTPRPFSNGDLGDIRKRLQVDGATVGDHGNGQAAPFAPAERFLQGGFSCPILDHAVFGIGRHPASGAAARPSGCYSCRQRHAPALIPQRSRAAFLGQLLPTLPVTARPCCLRARVGYAKRSSALSTSSNDQQSVWRIFGTAVGQHG